MKLLRLHPIVDIFTAVSRMNPRHPRQNLLMVNLLINVFINLLFLDSNKPVGCGPDLFPGRLLKGGGRSGTGTSDDGEVPKGQQEFLLWVIDQSLEIWISALAAAPIIAAIAQLFTVEENLKTKLKSTPYSFRTYVWYLHEIKINRKYFAGQVFNNMCTLTICQYIWNFGNTNPDALLSAL